MQLKSRQILCVGLLLAIFTCLAGCSRGIKEGIYALKGASGETTLIKGQAEQIETLAYNYGGYRVEPFTTDLGEACPVEFLEELKPAIEEKIKYRSRSIKETITRKDKEELGPFFTGPADKIIVIKGRVVQYDMGKIERKVMGALDEALCRINVIDEGTGELLVDFNATSRVKSSVRTGPKELAKGIASAVKDILKPKDPD